MVGGVPAVFVCYSGCKLHVAQNVIQLFVVVVGSSWIKIRGNYSVVLAGNKVDLVCQLLHVFVRSVEVTSQNDLF